MNIGNAAEPGADQFSLAAQQGYIKIIQTKSGVIVASWRGDIALVNPLKEPHSTQLVSDYGALERDATSFDATANGLEIMRTANHRWESWAYILHIPYAALSAQPLAKQPVATATENPAELTSVKYMRGDVRQPFSVLTHEELLQNNPYPFTDMSTCENGVTTAFEYSGMLYVWELANEANSAVVWQMRRKVTAPPLNRFVCFRTVDQYQVLTVDGRRFRVEERGLTPLDEKGEPLGQAPAATEKNVAEAAIDNHVALVIDRTGEVPVAFRLWWNNSELHALPGDTEKGHEEVAVSATKAIEILATSPSIADLRQLELKQRELDKQIEAGDEAPPLPNATR